MTREEMDERIAGELPDWIEGPLDCDDIAAIQYGGCASGAYMPAVTYDTAVETMSKHGDDVLDFIEHAHGEAIPPRGDESWAGIAVHYLSTAVELWAGQFDLDEVG